MRGLRSRKPIGFRQWVVHITIHLLNNGEEEQDETIPAGGSTCLKQIKKDTEYTVGIHADVPEDTLIKLTAYDGEETDAEP